MRKRDAPAEGGSYRDPTGFIFNRSGILYRQVNRSYAECYNRLMSSGLYEALTGSRQLVTHEEQNIRLRATPDAFKVIRPELIPFVSYPYEWSFAQLHDAALLTLNIQRTALAHGMSLKDATPFNVQFRGCRPVLIDTLSFELHREGAPWVAYRQFCEQFLAPLCLMSYGDERIALLFRPLLEGIPLSLAVRLLPRRARLRAGLFTHIFLHAGAQKKFEDKPLPLGPAQFRRHALLGLLESLERTVSGLRPPGRTSHWMSYYETCSYESQDFEKKLDFVKRVIAGLKPGMVWDLGANTGRFSAAAAETGAYCVAMDLDAKSIDSMYRAGKEKGEERILPLVMDLVNPSPSLGWQHRERKSLIERAPADLTLALALVHHLAIGRNVPLSQIAEFLASVSKAAVVEFVPKEDPQVRRLLRSREDVFPSYDRRDFEREFERYFRVVQKQALEGSGRVLYLLERRRTRS